MAVYDSIDRSRGDSDGASHGILRYPHRSEVLLKQDLAGCYGLAHGRYPLPYDAIGFQRNWKA